MIVRPGKYLRNIRYPDWDHKLNIPMNELTNTRGAARQLGFSMRTLQTWQSWGVMPDRLKVGKEMHYRRADIALIERGLKLLNLDSASPTRSRR